MLFSGLKIKVKKIASENREFLGKDGTTKVKRLVVNIASVDKDGDFIKLTSFDPTWPLPKEGEEWVVPPVRRFECFDGMIQSIMV